MCGCMRLTPAYAAFSLTPQMQAARSWHAAEAGVYGAARTTPALFRCLQGCSHMACRCGARFCYGCGKRKEAG